MEKRVTLFLLLTFAIIFLWPRLFPGPKPPPKPPPADQPPAEAPPEGPAPAKPPVEGAAPPVVPAEDVQAIVIQNDVLRLTFSTLGATLETAELLDFLPGAGEGEAEVPLRLLQRFDPARASLVLTSVTAADTFLDRSNWKAAASDDGLGVTFSLSTTVRAGGAPYPLDLRKELRLPGRGARHLEVRIVAGAPSGTPGSEYRHEFRLDVTGGVFTEPGGNVMGPPHSVRHQVDEKGESDLTQVPVSELKPDKPAESSFRGKQRFVADLSNYFGAFLALTRFPTTTCKTAVALVQPERREGDAADPHRGDTGPHTRSIVEFGASIPGGGERALDMVLYLGPTDAAVMSEAMEAAAWPPEEGGGAVGDAFSLVYDEQLGWASFIGRTVLALLRWLHGIIGNWGWSIVVLTIIVRAVLFPVNRRSQGAMLKHSEGMARIRPRIEALKEKHKGNQQKVLEEQMKIMREEGVKMVPLGGCLPLLLQIPIFFGLFSALRASISLRGAEWLWVDDLSRPDNLIPFGEQGIRNFLTFIPCCAGPQPERISGLHLLPILMTAAWVGSSLMMPKPQNIDPQMEQQRKIMTFMPVIMGIFMYNYAAALSLYWLTSSLVGMFESKVIKKYFPVKAEPPRRGGTAPGGPARARGA